MMWRRKFNIMALLKYQLTIILNLVLNNIEKHCIRKYQAKNYKRNLSELASPYSLHKTQISPILTII
jgi:hypothetical protein